MDPQSTPLPPTISPSETPHQARYGVNKTLVIVLGIVAVLLLAVGSYFLGRQSTRLQSLPITPTQTALPTPTPDSTSNWKIFNSPQKEYTFKYPPGWTVTEIEYKNTTEVLIGNGGNSIVISEGGSYPFGFGDPETKFERKEITFSINERQYPAEEVIVNNSSAYINLQLGTEKDHYILIGSPNGVGTLEDYNKNKSLILQLLSTLTFKK